MAKATVRTKKAATKKAAAKKAAKKAKWVYFFGNGKAEGRGNMKELLGGKGAGLAEMTRAGIPVPAGFTITTEACAEYFERGRRFPPGLEEEVMQNMERLERATGKRFSDPSDPLLVSVRSGAAISMPGMMETVLNLGLNDQTVEGLAALTGDRRFAYDAYRRFIQMYSSVVMGLERTELDQMLEQAREASGAKDDAQIPAEHLQQLCQRYKAYYEEKTGSPFPQDAMEQLWGAIRAVFESWMGDKAVTYRRVEKISGLKGTAVNVVQMVFGNMGNDSGTGVCFTRDPSTGEKVLFGDFLINAQGEDVVAGIRNTLKLTEMQRVMPKQYRELVRICNLLERHYKDMQDVEFTIERGKLYMLQTRTGKRSPAAAFRIAVDMVRERLITKEEAILRIKPEDVERLFYPVLDPNIPKEELDKARLATGINAVPGAAKGKVALSAKKAEQMAEQVKEEQESKKKRGQEIDEHLGVILVRPETAPEDVGGMHAAKGILTATGGKTSHAAVVARGWGKCCIVGCSALQIDEERKMFTAGDRVVREGDIITLDGSDGTVYQADFPLVQPELPKEYYTLMKWVDQVRTIGVRANADTPKDARKALEMGAEGIGLCRTEHMFFGTEERQLAIQEMILADDVESRRKALAKLLPFQRQDFIGLFEAMACKPVIIRLIDPPLHEFVPKEEDKQRVMATRLGVPLEKIKARVEQLHEANPMLGHRGCRLCLTYPEVLEMQVRAIVEAAVDCKKRGVKVLPEIMHPLVMDRRELEILTERTHQVAEQVMAETGVKVKYLVGTMIEVPRAALLADQIAEVAQFFSFGTNDLTQMTMGLSRDDAGRFLVAYVDKERLGIFSEDPFQSIDIEGVGKLVRMGIELGRKTNPELEVGICGEHGGEARSVKFCVAAGMDYVSCSPFRVPIARLAAAQAALQPMSLPTDRKPGRAKGKAGGKGNKKPGKRIR